MEFNTKSSYKRKSRRTVKTNRVSTSISLPKDYPWKVLNFLLNDVKQHIPVDDCDLVKQIIRSRDFYSYCLLQDVWGLQSINTQNAVDLAELKAKYALCSLLKKYQFKSDEAAQVDSAKTKFYKAEDLCRNYNHSGCLNLLFADSEKGAKILTDARSFIAKVLGQTCPTLSMVVKGSRHGPGSNLDTENGLTSKYYKYRNWPYSCTKSAIPYARFLIETDARWLGALEDSYRSRNNIPKTLILNRETFWSSVFKVVDENRIVFVPKDALTKRTIAIEPTMNLMLQLGVDGFIRRRLKRYDVDLDSQVKNQVFAGVGSKTGRYATLDLSMASDTLSIQLIKALLPPDWFSYLMKLRCPKGRTPEDEVISYEKISSMGNGYTFALESLVFAAICYAVIRGTKDTVNFREDFCVFGDDIAIKSQYAESLSRVLPTFGLTVNIDKSFLSGKVRESCGTDWYEGIPVRPVFLKTEPESLLELFTDINRLKRYLALHFGTEKSETVEGLENFVPDKYRGVSGPLSNTEFDSYLHSALKGKYKDGCWEHYRIVKSPILRNSTRSFLFRKLMHSLGEHVPADQFSKVKSGGNRFDVVWPKAFTSRKKISRTSFWCEMYTFTEPLSLIKRFESQISDR